MKIDSALLRSSWQAWWANDGRRAGPEWLQLTWTVLFSMAMAAVFTIISLDVFLSVEGAWRDWQAWGRWYGVNLVVALSIGLAIHALFALGAAWLGAARIGALRGLRRVLYFGGLPMLGVLIGWPTGAWLVSLGGPQLAGVRDADLLVGVLLIGALVTTLLYQYFGLKSRQLEAERQAAEAQLRLLQAQIEPHFLFNTLAGVQALIDDDPARAKQMLQAFTDHLRASLGALRSEQVRLDDELALVGSYLVLMQSRMEDRLRFTIDADAATRQLAVPPLLLQPLVENAVRHGLEPTLNGGHVTISARQPTPKTLVLEVHDDGRGPGGPAQPGGAGIALDNIRQRLQGRWGDAARLELIDAQPGTRVRVTLPATHLNP